MDGFPAFHSGIMIGGMCEVTHHPLVRLFINLYYITFDIPGQSRLQISLLDGGMTKSHKKITKSIRCLLIIGPYKENSKKNSPKI